MDRRNYTGSSNGLGAPVGKEIETKSPLALALVVDITGSMREWPQLIFEKIPTLYAEANVALQGIKLEELQQGKTLEDVLDVSVIAVGDAKGDRAPLQVLEFSKGADLVNGINKIYPEGNGGGNAKESYDLAAYYLLNHCKTPNVPKGAKPLCIIAGDEGFYERMNIVEIKDMIGDDLDEGPNTTEVMKQLADRFDTFILRPELHYNPSTYARIHEQWQEVLGDQRAIRMPSPERLVDCIIGICAYAGNNFEIGEELLKRRQSPSQVKEVLKALHSLRG
jgi:hypothetical protein